MELEEMSTFLTATLSACIVEAHISSYGVIH